MAVYPAISFTVAEYRGDPGFFSGELRHAYPEIFAETQGFSVFPSDCEANKRSCLRILKKNSLKNMQFSNFYRLKNCESLY